MRQLVASLTAVLAVNTWHVAYGYVPLTDTGLYQAYSLVVIVQTVVLAEVCMVAMRLTRGGAR